MPARKALTGKLDAGPAKEREVSGGNDAVCVYVCGDQIFAQIEARIGEGGGECTYQGNRRRRD